MMRSSRRRTLQGCGVAAAALSLAGAAPPVLAQSPLSVSTDLSPCTRIVFHQIFPGPVHVDSSPRGQEGPFSLCVSDGAGTGVRVQVSNPDWSPVRVSTDLSPCTQIVFHQIFPGRVDVDSSPRGQEGPFSVCVSDGNGTGVRVELDTE